jgi:hypothetical protein
MKRSLLPLAKALLILLASHAVAAEPDAAANAAAQQPLTFTKDIAPLVFKHCAECHRAGEVAPFSLLQYSDVKKRAKQIVEITADRTMPPWQSVSAPDEFIGQRGLHDNQIAILARWLKEGALEGAPGDLPPPPQFPDGWKLGKPDIVITMPAAYAIPADGPDVYRNFVFALDVPKGKYIKAAEYRPSNRKIVHHAVLAVDTTGRVRAQQSSLEQGFKGSATIPGRLFPGEMSTWTPGRDPIPLGEGFSMPWKEGADFVLQLHLHPSGKPEEEQSSIGFFLTDQPPQKSMVDILMIDKKIDIPPGEASYRTRDEFTLPIDMDVLGVFPHMHLLGRDIRVTAYPPEGEQQKIIWIPKWDFNWQTFYQYVKPVSLKAGTRVVLEGVHDNSAENGSNPNKPPTRVVWGEQTTNEMTVAFLHLVPSNEADLPKLKAALPWRILSMISPSKK